MRLSCCGFQAAQEESESEDEEDEGKRERFKSERGSGIVKLTSSKKADIPDKLGMQFLADIS